MILRTRELRNERKLSWDTRKNGSIKMIQERTNGTRKMDQAMKRKRILFTQRIEDKHVEIGKEENIHKPKAVFTHR